MATTQETFVAELRRDMTGKRIALMLGTGVSAALSGDAPTATWKGLLSDGVAFIGDMPEPISTGAPAFASLLAGDADTAALLACAEWLDRKFATLGSEYESWLKRTIGDLPPVATPLVGALPDVDIIVTTNYDHLWKVRYRRACLAWNARNANVEFFRDPRRYVFHLHGEYQQSSSVVLSGFDYGHLEADNHSQALLRQIATGHSLLMIGCGAGLKDPNLSRLLEWLKAEQSNSPYRHYMLLTSNEASLINWEDSLKSRLTPVIYGDAHRELGGFLSETFGLATGKDEVISHHPESVEAESVHYQQTAGYLQSLGGMGLPPKIIEEVERQLGDYDELSTFQKDALSAASTVVQNRASALYLTVTGTGKTTLARVAMNLAVGTGQSAISLLPTKALVAQELAHWNSWGDLWRLALEKPLRVYAASRDYPESDRPVSRGRYDIAVAIYEKLGVYLVTGRTPLANTSVVVVDEMQILLEAGDRAAKLEAILTMIKLMPATERPAVLGLSPTLGIQATTALCRWLEVGEDLVLSTNERPVPLDTYVVDALRWKKQLDAHLFNVPGRQPEITSDSVSHSLAGRMHESSTVLAGRTGHLVTGELAATLIDTILEDDPTRRILCFVPSRTAAVELTNAVQALLKNRLGQLDRGSPWAVGRFVGDTPRKGMDERYTSVRYSDLPSADDAIRGLREGVAAHTAAFPASLRRLLEDEFRREDGLLRVLVATDTLAMGINLPADTVIATSLAGYSGSPGRRRLLSAGNLDNKAGRAGRRGETSKERGDFYLLVPPRHELEGIEGLSTEDIRTFSTVEGVFDAYVTEPRRPPQISSKYRTLKDVSSLVLQVLCQDGFARSDASLLARVEAIVAGMLLSYEDDSDVPRPTAIVDELLTRELLGPRPDGKVALTGLGMALGTSSLDLDLSSTLERVARLACANSGRIDLLWNTCRSSAIQNATEWVSLPPVAPKHLPSMKDAVIEMANAYCADAEVTRRYSAVRVGIKNYEIADQLLTSGSAVVSEELRKLLITEGEHADDADVTALLRALVAYEWSLGIDFGALKARFTRGIRSSESERGARPVHLKLFYSDVEQLCDQIAGVLRGAASVSYSQDGVDYSSQVRVLASEIECGLPSWLAPVARMRLPSLHRERLTFLWDSIPPELSLSEILMREEIAEHAGITREDLEDAKRLIEAREEEERAQRNRIAQRWANLPVPRGEGDTFEDVGDRLDVAQSSGEYLQTFADLMDNIGLVVGQGSSGDFFESAEWGTGAQSVRVYVPHGALTADAVDSVRGNAGLVILRSRLTPSAMQSLSRPTRVIFAQPEHLLSIIATLVKSRGPGLDAEEVMERLSSIRTSSVEAESWHLYEGGSLESPPPFTGLLPRLDEGGPLPVASEDTSD